jgi:transposase
VLPDRSVETVSAWFEKHPTVEIVSRDRSSEYATAIRKGAPQALQVADLWHIGKNLADSVQTLLARCRAEIRRALQVQARPVQEREETEPVPEEERRPPRSRSVEVAREGRRAQKLDRYTQVVELHHQGLRAVDIASRVGIGERTVHRWLRNGSFPEARQRRRRPSLIDPYERYVLKWWQEGNRNGSLMRDYLRKVNPRKHVLCSFGHVARQQAATTRPLTSAIQPCGPKARVRGILVCCTERPSLSLFECNG